MWDRCTSGPPLSPRTWGSGRWRVGVRRALWDPSTGDRALRTRPFGGGSPSVWWERVPLRPRPWCLPPPSSVAGTPTPTHPGRTGRGTRSQSRRRSVSPRDSGPTRLSATGGGRRAAECSRVTRRHRHPSSTDGPGCAPPGRWSARPPPPVAPVPPPSCPRSHPGSVSGLGPRHRTSADKRPGSGRTRRHRPPTSDLSTPLRRGRVVPGVRSQTDVSLHRSDTDSSPTRPVPPDQVSCR